MIVKRVKITTDQGQEKFLSSFGTLFQEFNYKGLSSCYFYLIFVMRRYAIVAATLFFSSALFKILVAVSFSLLVKFIQACFYLMFVEPFKDKMNQKYLILNELLTVAYWGYIALQNLMIIEYDRATQGSNCIKIIAVALGLNILFDMMIEIYVIYRYIKIFVRRKINPVNNNANPLTNFNDSKSPNTQIETKN